MSRSVARMFADATALLEDMHGVAVEGQRRDNPAELQLALASSLRIGLVRIDRVLIDIGGAIGDRR